MALDAQAKLEEELLDREAERCSALVDDDMEALADLVTDDLVHVHTTGNVHDKAQLLNHAGSFLRFIDVQRGQLTIRQVSPGVAVMTGPMTNTVGRREINERVNVQAFVTQVWVRGEDGKWRIASFHAVRIPDAA